MTCIAVQCPPCHRAQVVKRGNTARGAQRSLGQNATGVTGCLLLDSRHRGCLPEVQQPVIDMRLNARGSRDTARVLRSSTATVLRELKPIFRPNPKR
jgi:transposase-like protein